MCGIAGGFGKLSPDSLSKMIKAMGHRGPDHSGKTSIGDVHLGHARLSIIDPSAASNQPCWDFDKKACIVFNGEIYNYQSLRQDLIEKGYKFNSEGDSEVLVNLYLEYGEELFKHVNGIYAFAVWDVELGQLLLARDPFGVKPLYYYQNVSGFYFASEIKSLLHVDSFKSKIDHDALLRSLVFLWSPGESTLLQGVSKLKPGHFVVVKERVICKNHCFWDWPEYRPLDQSPEDSAKYVLQALELSVEDQLVSDVPVGAFLSGGLDSSLLVGLAKRKAEYPIECFTINMGKSNNEFVDDLPYAKKVAKYLSVPLNTLDISPDIVNVLPKMVYHLDELQADVSAINVMLICEQARQKGIKVMLSGAGGDDLFTGYRRHYAVSMERYWAWLPKSFRRNLKLLASLLPRKYVVSRRIAKALQYADLDSSERLLSYFYWIDPEIVRSIFVDNVSSTLSKSPMDFMLSELNNLETKEPVEKMLHLERKYFLVDHNFNYTDKMSMATGVEVRVPFLDQRVVNEAAKVDVKFKQKGSVGKWILKKAAESVLPIEIIYRPKSGFGAPLRKWMKSDLEPVVAKYLSEERLTNRGIFKPDRVQSLIEDDRRGVADYSYTIFALLCFEIWCEHFIDPDFT